MSHKRWTHKLMSTCRHKSKFDTTQIQFPIFLNRKHKVLDNKKNNNHVSEVKFKFFCIEETKYDIKELRIFSNIYMWNMI